MREPIKDRNRLEHILEAIDRILNSTQNMSLDELDNNSIVFYGIIKSIEIIGEAAYHLTKAFRDSHPETPWDSIMRMRHVLVHDYYRINADEVRFVIEDNLRPLRDQVNDYLTNTNWSEWIESEKVVNESVVHKNLVQTAKRMKQDGMDIDLISRYTGLCKEDIETL